MEPATLSSLSWAIDRLGLTPMADRDSAFYGHLDRLNDLLLSAQCDALSWDYSRRDLVAFMRKHSWTIPQDQFDQWRMVPPVDQRPGAISGLPQSRGTLRATNGILCLIETADGELFEGHLEFFEVDPAHRAVRINHDGTPKKESRAAVEQRLIESLDFVV